MAVIELKGLQGLKGLSQQERDEWYKNNPKNYNRTEEQADRVYRNQLFINKYGRDYFKAVPDYNERDVIYFKDTVQDAFDDTFYKEEDYDALNKLTPEGKLELLQQYQPTSEYEKYKKEELEKSKKYDESFWGKVSQSLAQGDTGVQIGTSQEENLSDIFEGSDVVRQNLKKDIINRDLDRVLHSETVQNRTSEILLNMDTQVAEGKISLQQLEADVDNILLGQPQQPEFSTSIGNNASPNYYKAYKDSKYLEDLTLDDKKKRAAETIAMSEATDNATAYYAANNDLQNYIHDKQNWWERRGLSAMNIGTGAIKELTTPFTAVTAGVITAIYGEKGLANYLNGLDPKTGEPLNFFLSPKYWEDVDRYNTFSPTAQARAEEAGGISTYNPVYSVGTGMSGEQILDEALKMNKFALAFFLMGGVESIATRGLASRVGGTFTRSVRRNLTKEALEAGESKVTNEAAEWYTRNAVLNLEGSSTAAKVINKIGAYTQLATPASSIGWDYAYQGYENALNTAGQQINEEIARRAGIRVEEIQNSPEFETRLQNNVSQRLKEIFSDENGNLMSDDNISLALQAMFKYEDDPTKNMERLQRIIAEEEKTKLTYDIYNEIAPEIANSEEIKNLENAAVHSAIVTFQVDGAIETISQLGVTKLFRGYLFDKGTKAALNSNNPFLRNIVATENKLGLETVSPQLKVALNTIKPVLGGAWSNYFDDIRLATATGYGMHSFNSLLEKQLNPDAYVETSNILSDYIINPLLAANEAGQKALTDVQSFRDGFIGGLGTITTFGLGRGKYGRQNRIQGKNIFDTFARNFNRYINNPLFEAYSATQENLEQVEDIINQTNAAVAKHTDNLNNISKFIAGEQLSTDAQLNNDFIDAKDAKAYKAFELGALLYNLNNGEFTRMAPAVQKEMQLIQDIVNDNLTEEQWADLTNQLINQPSNKSLKESSNAEQQARALLKENAQKILDVSNSIEQVDAEIKKSKLEGKISNEMRNQLIYMQYMNQEWQSRLDEINNDLFPLHREFGDLSNPSLYGSKKSWQKELTHQENVLEELKNKRATLKNDFEILKITRKREKSAEERTKQDELLIAKRIELDAIAETIEQLELDVEQIKAAEQFFDENGNAPILDEADIMSLDAYARAHVLNEANLSDYSKKQQAIIKKTLKNLLNRDAEALEKIKDSSELQYRIEQNRDSYTKILRNPEAFNLYTKSLNDARAKIVINKFLEETKQNQYNRLLDASGRGDKRRKNPIVTPEFTTIAKQTHSNTLESFVKTYPEYSSILESVIERNKATEAIAKTIDSFDVTEAQKKALKNSLYTITENANTEQEVIDSIEDFIDTITDNSEGELVLREQMNEILDRARDFNLVRNAAKVENRGNQLQKDRKALEAKKRRQQKAEERKAKRQAEKEAKQKQLQIQFEEEQKAKAAEEERLKQEEEAKQKGEQMKGALEDTNEIPTEESLQNANLEDVDLGIKYDPNVSEVRTPEQSESEDTVELEPVTTQEQELPPTAETSESNQMRGNVLTPYDIGDKQKGTPNLLEEGKAFSRKEKVDTWLADFFKWMDNAGINYQDIIDFELAEIAKLNPVVHYMMATAEENATNDRVLVRTPLLVVEATDAVKAIHKEDRGGIIRANGKDWLVIGMLGYNGDGEFATYKKTVDKLAMRRDAYFRKNPTERFTVDEKYTTSLKDIALGRLVRQIEGDTEVTYRTISELLSDAKRNPYNLTWKDLAFAIQMRTGGFDLSRHLEGVKVTPAEIEKNAGNVFLMIKTANGKWIPAVIKPIVLSDIKPGALQDRIDNLFKQVINPDHKVRLDAINKLQFLLHLDTKNNILVGTDKINVLTIKQNGVNSESFDLSSPDLNRAEVFRKLKKSVFRIQITKNNLQDLERLKELDDAGALTTNVAVLGTVGSHYTVNATDLNTGKPIETEVIQESNNTVRGSQLNQSKEPSQLLDGKRVSKHNENWYDENGKIITDALTLQKISTLNYIEEHNIPVAYTTKQGYDAFIISDNNSNPKVAFVNWSHNVMLQSGQQALNAITFYENQQKAKAAEEVKLEDIDLGLEENQEPIPSKRQEIVTENNTQPKEKYNKSEKFSEVTREKSLKDLQDSNILLTFADVLMKDREIGKHVMESFKQIFKEKGWAIPSIKNMDNFLKSKDIALPTSLNKENIDSWLDMIKNCK